MRWQSAGLRLWLSVWPAHSNNAFKRVLRQHYVVRYEDAEDNQHAHDSELEILCFRSEVSASTRPLMATRFSGPQPSTPGFSKPARDESCGTVRGHHQN